MWTYEQKSGLILWPSGEKLSTGYSGNGEGLNAPEMESVHGVGPIPCGTYTMQEPVNSPTHGPFAIPLVPDPANQMFGRSAFLIHGDEIAHAGEHLASHGCIVTGVFTRKTMWESQDRLVMVIAG